MCGRRAFRRPRSRPIAPRNSAQFGVFDLRRRPRRARSRRVLRSTIPARRRCRAHDGANAARACMRSRIARNPGKKRDFETSRGARRASTRSRAAFDARRRRRRAGGRPEIISVRWLTSGNHVISFRPNRHPAERVITNRPTTRDSNISAFAKASLTVAAGVASPAKRFAPSSSRPLSNARTGNGPGVFTSGDPRRQTSPAAPLARVEVCRGNDRGGAFVTGRPKAN